MKKNLHFLIGFLSTSTQTNTTAIQIQSECSRPHFLTGAEIRWKNARQNGLSSFQSQKFGCYSGINGGQWISEQKQKTYIQKKAPIYFRLFMRPAFITLTLWNSFKFFIFFYSKSAEGKHSAMACGLFVRYYYTSNARAIAPPQILTAVTWVAHGMSVERWPCIAIFLFATLIDFCIYYYLKKKSQTKLQASLQSSIGRRISNHA